MLVLTRRESEKIVFPDLGVTVEIVSLSGNRARIGVDAPRDVRILRQEIMNSRAVGDPMAAAARPSAELSHAMRNRLQKVGIAARLANRQLAAGLVGDAQQTLVTLLEELESLNREAAAERGARPQPPQPASRPVKGRALLVDDDENERKLLAGFLRMTGYQVDVAGDGADALDYLRTHDRPDIVLLDMLMPRCDGPSAIGQIRNDPHLDGLKVFAVSGTSPGRVGVETGPRGVDVWFQKPIDPEELVRAMDQLVPGAVPA
ncbi:MAG TPA: response regulator [Planctomycetaceae bacterium]|nr:response regulator [Planctomycetaceae bacterium]